MILRLYAVIARIVLSAEFHRRHARQMQVVFADLVAEARLRGVLAVAWVVFRDILALVRVGIGERLQRDFVPHHIVTQPSGVRETLATTIRDMRYASRMLRRSPGFAAIAVLTLGLGVGANTAIFSAVNGVLLKPLPYLEPNRLVAMAHSALDGSPSWSTTTLGDFVDWNRATSFSSMAAYSTVGHTLTGVGEPQRVRGTLSVGSMFEVLGVPPLLGRTFGAAEDGPSGERVIVLSYRAWQRWFGLDEGAIGGVVNLSGQLYTVVGVMPPGFVFPDAQAEYWIPSRYSEADRRDRTQYFLWGIGRLAPGVTLSLADAEMETISVRLRADYPVSNANVRVGLEPIHEQIVSGVQNRLWVLMGAVAFVLLIACSNLANLLLARSMTRRREIALRMALGAGRGRLLRQLLTESLILAALGAVVGLVLGAGLLELLLALTADTIPRSEEITIDLAVLAFTLGISTLAGLVFGSFPAVHASRTAPGEVLHEGTRASEGRSWVRSALVVSEIGLALVLLTGSGLLLRSFWLLMQVEPGVRVERVLTFDVSLPRSNYPQPELRTAFFSEAVQRIEGLPGVTSAAIINVLPLTGRGIGAWFNIIGRPVPATETPPIVLYRVVSPEYFRTMDLELAKGRAFDHNNRVDTSPAIVINETLAARFWPDDDPLGKQIVLGPLDEGLFPPATIVGIVRDVKNLGLNGGISSVAYVPHAVMPYWSRFNFAVHTAIDPISLSSAVRAQLREMDPALPVADLRTMEQVVETTVSAERTSTILLGLFAVVAVTMAAVGVFGVLSYTVTQRSRELGIRMALGANAGSVRRLVVRQGMTPVLLGVGLGLGGAVVLTRFLSSMLFGVSATDPLTLASVVGLLTVIAVAASYIPARRATQVDPMQVLRSD